MTPIATAAKNGHAHVVRYLLMTCIADPTLEGCPDGNDVCVDALSAVDYKGKGDPDVPQVWALTHFLLCLSEVKLRFVEGCF